MQHSPDTCVRSFREAFKHLEEAIRMEGISNRVAVHPYMTLFRGVANYIDMSGSLLPKELDSIRSHLNRAQGLFHHDRALVDRIISLRSQLKD